jgi:hypothetical protein
MKTDGQNYWNSAINLWEKTKREAMETLGVTSSSRHTHLLSCLAVEAKKEKRRYVVDSISEHVYP